MYDKKYEFQLMIKKGCFKQMKQPFLGKLYLY